MRVRAAAAYPGARSGPGTANGTPRGAVALGAPGGIRTPNLLIRSQMLYPLSYGRVATEGRRRWYPALRTLPKPGGPHFRASRGRAPGRPATHEGPVSGDGGI